MADKLPTLPSFAAGSYAAIQSAVADGQLSYPAYAYVSDVKQFAFVDKSLDIQLVKGANVMNVDVLPEIEDGDENTLYILDGIVYTFTGTKYNPMYTDITDEVLVAFEKLNSKIDALAEVVENLSDATSGLVFSSYEDFPEVGVDDQLYIDTSTDTIYRYDDSAAEYVEVSKKDKDLIFVELGADSDDDINQGLPESSSTFFKNFTMEDQKVVDEMEADKTAVFKEDKLEEHTGFSEYLGCYELVAETGVKTLASPTKVEDEYAIGAVVMHYNEETGAWEKIEDAEIIDGYVWATFDNLSPVAAYTVSYKAYETTIENKYPSLCLNGLPGVITENPDDETKVDITTIQGDVFTMDSENLIVLGATADAPDHSYKNTSVTMESGTLWAVLGSSYNTTDTVEQFDTIDMIINGGTVKNTVSAANGRVQADTVNTVVNGGEVNIASAGVQAYINGFGNFNKSNSDENSDSRALYSNVTVNGGKVNQLYVAGTSGYNYTKEAHGVVNDGEVALMLACSNGNMDKIIYNIHGGEVNLLHSVNRGNVKDATFNVDGGKVTTMFLGGDATDSSVTGTIETADATITGGAVTVYPGTTGGEQIKASDGIISAVNYVEGTTTFADGFEEEFADVIHKIETEEEEE